MTLSIVVAMAQNNVIGHAGGLPWHLSSDLKRFKALTLGKPILMGRKCYESIGRPLPGRPNIVLSHALDFAPPGVIIAHSLEAGLERARIEAKRLAINEIAIIGGGVVYELTLPMVDVLYVTHIDAPIEGDTFFPYIDPGIWQPVETQRVPAGERDEYPSVFVVYKRR